MNSMSTRAFVGIALLVTVAALTVAGVGPSNARGAVAGGDRTPAPPAAEVRFLALGDWGLDTNDRHTVADAMAAYMAANGRPDAALLLGDNYKLPPGHESDDQFHELFEGTYDAKRFDFPFYAALGNHDYEKNKADIELSYTAHHDGTRWHMPSRWYRVDFPQDKPLVTVFVLDSNKDDLPAESWLAQTQWMKQELAKPHGKWTICCCHHTMFSNGAHGDNGVLQTTWGPILKQNKVDFFLCGHDHTLQHLELDGWSTSFVVSGGGGAGRKPMLRDNRGPFSKSVIGFAAFDFTPEKTAVRLLGGDGALLHEFTRDSAGHVVVAHTTPGDKATTHPLAVIQGMDNPVATPASRPAKPVRK
jgi:tartrate-resistant acid phosphatase type 5